MRLTEVKPSLRRRRLPEAIAGRRHREECRQRGDARCGEPHDADLQRLGRPPRRRRHHQLHGRLQRPASGKDVPAEHVGNYVGIRIGIDVAGKSTAMTKYSNLIVESTTPYLWFNAAEATFLRAEYELRWGSEDGRPASSTRGGHPPRSRSGVRAVPTPTWPMLRAARPPIPTRWAIQCRGAEHHYNCLDAGTGELRGES